VSFCGNCGAERVPGDTYCAICGRAYAERTVSQDDAEDAPDAVRPATPASADAPFPDWAGIAAGALTFFMPLISLIVALVMRSSERSSKRRGFLKNWAVASGAWLCTGWFIAFLVISSSGAFSGGGCKGGPDPFAVPTSFTSTDNKHWTATVSCVNGGTTTRPARKGEVP
jgi:hypothetical protein